MSLQAIIQDCTEECKRVFDTATVNIMFVMTDKQLVRTATKVLVIAFSSIFLVPILGGSFLASLFAAAPIAAVVGFSAFTYFAQKHKPSLREAAASVLATNSQREFAANIRTAWSGLHRSVEA